MMELTETYYEKGSDGSYTIVQNPVSGQRYYIKQIDVNGNESFVEATKEDSKIVDDIGNGDGSGIRHPFQDLFIPHICTSIPGMFIILIHLIAYPIIITKVKKRLASTSDPQIRKGLTGYTILGAVSCICVPIGLPLFILFNNFLAVIGVLLIVVGEATLLIYALLMAKWLTRGFRTHSDEDDRIRIIDNGLAVFRYFLSAFGGILPLSYTLGFPVLFHRIVKKTRKARFSSEGHREYCMVVSGLGWTVWFCQIFLIIMFALGLYLSRADVSFSRIAYSADRNVSLSCDVPSNPDGIYWIRRAYDGQYSCSNSTSNHNMTLVSEKNCTVDILNLFFAPCDDLDFVELRYTCAGNKSRRDYDLGWAFIYFCLAGVIGYMLLFFVPWMIVTSRWLPRPEQVYGGRRPPPPPVDSNNRDASSSSDS